MQAEARLKVGEKLKIGPPMWQYYNIAYAGMPNTETFSFAVLEFDGVGYGYNLYFHKDRRELVLFGKRARIGPALVGLDT